MASVIAQRSWIKANVDGDWAASVGSAQFEAMKNIVKH